MNRRDPSMSDDWDLRAKEDAMFYIATERESWRLPDFFENGDSLADDLLRPALERLGFDPRGKRILDIGCGIGRLFPGFARVFEEIWGIDVSPEMIRQGREKCPVSDVKFFVGNGRELNGIEIESVDYCFSYQVLQHVPDVAVVSCYMNEIHRVLKPGGAFQLHFKCGERFGPRMLYKLPGSIRPLAQILFGIASLRWIRGRSIYRSVPGHLSTWIGSDIPPEEFVAKLKSLGFSQVETFRDPSEPSPFKYWVIGKKV